MQPTLNTKLDIPPYTKKKPLGNAAAPKRERRNAPTLHPATQQNSRKMRDCDMRESRGVQRANNQSRQTPSNGPRPLRTPCMTRYPRDQNRTHWDG